MNTEGLFEAALDYAKSTIIDAQKPLPPTWTLMNKEGEIIVIMTPWRNNQEKLVREMMLRLEMRERKTVAYGCVIEAWAATAPEGWTPENGQTLSPPSQRPDRKEVLIAFVNDGGSVTCKMWAIKRDWHDRAVSFELEKRCSDAGAWESWMTKLLD